MTTPTTPRIFDPDSGPRYRELMARARRANQLFAQQERAAGRTPCEDGDVSAALRAALTLLAEGIDTNDWLRVGQGLDLIQRGEVRVRAAPPVASGISTGVFDPPSGARLQQLLAAARRTNRERDAEERAADYAMPGDNGPAPLLRTAINAIACGIAVEDWAAVAEGVDMAQHAEVSCALRCRLVCDQRRESIMTPAASFSIPTRCPFGKPRSKAMRPKVGARLSCCGKAKQARMTRRFAI